MARTGEQSKMKGKSKKSPSAGGKKKEAKKATQAEAKEAEVVSEASDEPKPEEKAEEGQDLEALNARLLRLQADFDNFRKRTLREKNELFRRANEELLLELLPILDHMGIAVEAAVEHKADDAFIEGFRLVLEQLLTTLGRFGLTPIELKDWAFDPNLHEAISHIPSPDVPENKVIMQVRQGYRLGDRLLRATQVVVSSGKPEGNPVDAPDAADSDPDS